MTLRSALLQYQTRGEDALASALLEATPPGPRQELTARLAACQVLAVRRELAHTNHQRIAEGQSAADLTPRALAEADHAFSLLRGGLTTYA